MELIIWFGVLVSILLSITVARLPSLSVLSVQKRSEWDLSTSYAEQRTDAQEIAKEFRMEALQKVVFSFAATAVAFIILCSALFLFLVLDSGFSSATSTLFPYVKQKMHYVFRLSDGSAELVFIPGLNSIHDRVISLAFVAQFGSIVAFILSTANAFFVSLIFPVRWLKWPRHEFYLKLRKRKFKQRLIRRLKFLLTHEYPISKND
jgi:hypothetical protein